MNSGRKCVVYPSSNFVFCQPFVSVTISLKFGGGASVFCFSSSLEFEQLCTHCLRMPLPVVENT